VLLKVVTSNNFSLYNKFQQTKKVKEVCITPSNVSIFSLFFLNKEPSYTKLKYSKTPQFDIASGAVASLLAALLGFLITEKFGLELIDSGDFYTSLMYVIFMFFIARTLVKIHSARINNSSFFSKNPVAMHFNFIYRSLFKELNTKSFVLALSVKKVSFLIIEVTFEVISLINKVLLLATISFLFALNTEFLKLRNNRVSEWFLYDILEIFSYSVSFLRIRTLVFLFKRFHYDMEEYLNYLEDIFRSWF